MKMHLFLKKHNKDREHKGIEERWVGRVDNLKLRDDSKKKLEIRGDVLLADPIYAYQIRDMKAPYGLSAELRRDPLKKYKNNWRLFYCWISPHTRP